MQKRIKTLLTFVLMLCTTAAVFAQTVTVTGTVTDNRNEPLIGVNVQVRGTTTGAVTDIDGRYSLTVPGSQSVLLFSYVGYLPQEHTVGNQRTINVTLQEDLQSLEEVVVVGYGVQKKETVTGSVAMVRGDELLKSPASNLSHALVGRMAGVVTYQRSGEPGNDEATIRIRGINSFGESSPLVVIDGIADRAGGLQRLDPNEIETMSVLKDGAAAIYGARAANGVILITTKRGKAGQKPIVEYSANFGINTPTILPKMADAPQYAEMRNELIRQKAMVNPLVGETPAVTLWKTEEEIQKYRDGSDPWRYPNTDWYDATFKNWAMQQYHNATVSGGNDKMQYFATFGYRFADNNFINGYGGNSQYNLRINLDAQVNEWIKTSVSLMGREQQFKRGTQTPGDVLWFTSRGRPTDPAYWPNGLPGPAQEYGRNPVIGSTRETGYLHENRYFIQSTARAEITQPWIEGLKLQFTVAYDKMIQRDKQWYQPWYLYTWDGITVDGSNIPVLNRVLSFPGAGNDADPNLTERAMEQTNATLGTVLSYDRIFGAHGVSILVGAEKETGDYNYIQAYRRYFLSDAVQLLDAGGDLEKNATSGGVDDNWRRNWDRRRMNYFGRVAYNYQEKYLAEFLWRYDGSYMFPKDKRFGFFPGIMLGYRISEEDFWKSNLSFLDYFKIRGSWSSVGYDNIYYDNRRQEFQYLATYKYGYGMIINGRDEKSLEISRFPNPDITWERQDMINLGIEGRTLNSRLSFEADVFLNKRSQILWRRNASIPQTAGLTLPAENIGEVDNKGFDFRLGWNDRAGRDFMYDITLSGGFSENKIVFWDESPGAPEWQRSTGKMTDTYLYYVYDGVFYDWNEINDTANRPDYSGITSDAGLKPGDMKIQDTDGDGVITANDRVRMNRTNVPKWNMGLNANVQYKNFDLTFLFQGAFDAWTRVLHDAGEIGNWNIEIVNDHWSIANPSREHPRLHERQQYYWDRTSDNNVTTYFMRRTDYVRLKNAELGYTIPRHLIQQTKFFTHARIYVNGQNLLTFTGVGRDPEVTSSGATNYPLLKVLNAGFSLTF